MKKTLLVAIMILALSMMTACGNSDNSVAGPADPNDNSTSAEDYMSQVEAAAEQLGETEPQDAPDAANPEENIPPATVDFSRPPTPEQLTEIRTWTNEENRELFASDAEINLSGWENLVAGFHDGHLPLAISGAHQLNWSKKTGLSSYAMTIIAGLQRSPKSERHPELPTTIHSFDCFWAVHQVLEIEEDALAKKHWNGFPEKLFQTRGPSDTSRGVCSISEISDGWQAFVDEDLHRLGFVNFLNTTADGANLTPDDYIIVYFVYDETNDLCAMYLPILT
jgi:hypothetical protein